MSRTEFMQQLESLLQNISPAEREEALQYYNDYFDDAGPENEQDVMDALGNPARVAESIKRDQTINGTVGNSVKHPIVKRSDLAGGQEGQNGSTKNATEETPAWQIVLWIILGIILSPIAVSLITGLAGVLFGLVVTWFSLILGFGVAAFVLVALLFILGVIGVFNLVHAPLAGVGLIGGGLICGGIGILFMMLTVALAGIVTPAICKGIGQLWRFLKGKLSKEVIA